ncbi:hypothetical protein [Photobacterium nomapromontoriensis]|uniref:hypothetical protein n=1 Tax=Photobacterium nomapromontoriensis TaxID=2910237 RepID=UPI003D0B3FF3
MVVKLNPNVDLNNADAIINIAARAVAERRGMSIAVARNLLMLGTEPTRENAILFSRQTTSSVKVEVA